MSIIDKILPIKPLYPDSKLPTKNNPDDAGFDCYIHHFIEYHPKKYGDTPFHHLYKIQDHNTKEIKEDKIHEWQLESLNNIPENPNESEFGVNDDYGNSIACGLGFATAIPKGYYASILPRSGLALKFKVVTTTGTIDAGYRGEWTGIVVNLSHKDYTLKVGDKICQFVIKKLEPFQLQVVDTLEDSQRGTKGFGSSGL